LEVHASISGTAIFISSGRLEAPEAQIDQRRTVADAPQRDAGEQRDAQHIERHRDAGDRLRRDVGDEPHEHQRKSEARRLAGDARDALIGRREERDQPDAGDRERDAEQKAVDAPRQDVPQLSEELGHQSL
jgi:hypothetical protein